MRRRAAEYYLRAKAHVRDRHLSRAKDVEWCDVSDGADISFNYSVPPRRGGLPAAPAACSDRGVGILGHGARRVGRPRLLPPPDAGRGNTYRLNEELLGDNATAADLRRAVERRCRRCRLRG